MQMIKDIALAIMMTAGAIWILMIMIISACALIAGIRSILEEKRKDDKDDGTKR